MLKRFKKPYPTIGDIIDESDYDFDYVEYRVPCTMKAFEECKEGEEDEVTVFCGAFITQNRQILTPVDNDTYERDEKVIAYEKWSQLEKDIYHGLTIVVEGEIYPDMDNPEIIYAHEND